jgi:hypothetical protein
MRENFSKYLMVAFEIKVKQLKLFENLLEICAFSLYITWNVWYDYFNSKEWEVIYGKN